MHSCFIKHAKNKQKQTGLFSIRAEKQYSSFAGHWLVALLEHILPEHARGAGEVVAQLLRGVTFMAVGEPD